MLHHYRLFFYGPDGHIFRAPEIIECADDREAREKARQAVDGHDVELWDQDRFIARFPRLAKST